MATSYLPHIVHNVPAQWVFGSNGKPLQKIQHYMDQRIVRIIAGPNHCHVVIDVRRPHRRPPPILRLMAEALS